MFQVGAADGITVLPGCQSLGEQFIKVIPNFKDLRLFIQIERTELAVTLPFLNRLF